ncbi:hypothetical protein MMAD_55520 (plasmid) [Mycolicibacterium madagascariense]|uniref:Mce associated membrane protein n=1 Tax=Mycolicibacterium madagascariense TaxID=212765 RepID=A0A7I7XPS9_9MYCO|nr:Mce protein [Mycolicibacterium madagascariense]BBZ31257.1 hypothetical protein MMAD_55520 [Mycolicibacterium madagascariense]
MAKHDDTAEVDSPPIDDGSALDADDADGDDGAEGDHDGPTTKDDASPDDTATDVEPGEDTRAPFWRQKLASPTGAAAVCVTAIVALGALGGILGHQLLNERQESLRREVFVQAARQGVIDLTTIDYTSVEADVARILDSSTGAFHDDFQTRSQPYAEVIKQAKTKSQGTVTAAAMQSQDGDTAKVLVTVSMKMSNAGAPEQPSRNWRMLINVQKTGDTAKVSDVQFAT